MPTPLSNLSSDILGLVLNSQDSSYLMIDLWKTGDVLLRAKLASAITYLHLKDTFFDSTSRYPKLICELRNLRYLSLDRGEQPLMATSLDLSTEIQKLSSLRTLEIVSAEANECLLNHAPNWSQSNPCYTATRFGALTSSLVDMARLYPHLSKLKLAGPNDALSTFGGLPPTLTTLEIRFMKATASALASLPRSLTKFDGEMIGALTTSDWLHAPPTLTHVTQLDPSALGEFPPMLQYATVPYGYSLSENDLPSGRSPLPPNLRALGLHVHCNDGFAWTSFLPRRLERLSVYNIPLTPTCVASLPPTLTYLNAFLLSTEDDAEDASIARSSIEYTHWPPLLTDMEVGNVNSASLPNLSSISRLTSLRLSYVGSKLDGSVLPRTLAYLFVELPEEPISLLPGLPTSLKSLIIGGDFAGDGVESFRNLPSSLLELRASTFYYHSSRALPSYSEQLSLPSGLRSLVVGSWNSTFTLPCLLTTLNITKLSAFADGVDLPHLDPFKSFPATLTALEILVSEQETIRSEVAFSSLSRLRTLKIDASVQSSVLRGLSRSLTSLSLRMSAVSESDAFFFPPRLSTCKIDVPSNGLPSNICDTWPLCCRLWSRDKDLMQRFGLRKLAAKERSFVYPDPRVVERFSKSLSSSNE